MNITWREHVKPLLGFLFWVLLIVGFGFIMVWSTIEGKKRNRESMDEALNTGKHIGIKQVRVEAVSNGVAMWGCDVNGNVEFKWKK